MGILRGNRHSGGAAIELTRRDADDGLLTRCEETAISLRRAPTDPYAAWLERREAEERHDRPQIRWVYRHEARTRADRASGATPGYATREDGPGDAEGGLVTAA